MNQMEIGQIWQRNMSDITLHNGDYVMVKIKNINSGVLIINTIECNYKNDQWVVGDIHQLILEDFQTLESFDWFMVTNHDDCIPELSPGYNCSKCKLYFSCVALNHKDEYICYECRN